MKNRTIRIKKDLIEQVDSISNQSNLTRCEILRRMVRKFHKFGLENIGYVNLQCGKESKRFMFSYEDWMEDFLPHLNKVIYWNLELLEGKQFAPQLSESCKIELQKHGHFMIVNEVE